jgi:hypothetical protein
MGTIDGSGEIITGFLSVKKTLCRIPYQATMPLFSIPIMSKDNSDYKKSLLKADPKRADILLKELPSRQEAGPKGSAKKQSSQKKAR